MRFWLIFPLTMLMLSPLWLTRLEARMEGRGGLTTAEGGGGIPPHYAEGGGGIPPHYAEGGGGIPPK
jgi:hypothetical protein